MGTGTPDRFVSHTPRFPNKREVVLILATAPPDSISIAEFMRREDLGRCPVSESRNPFTCALTGRTYSVSELFHRSESLAKAFSQRLGWLPNEGTAWEKVVAIFALNTVSDI